LPINVYCFPKPCLFIIYNQLQFGFFFRNWDKDTEEGISAGGGIRDAWWAGENKAQKDAQSTLKMIVKISSLTQRFFQTKTRKI